MLATEITEVVTAVVWRILDQTGHQTLSPQEIADLIGRQLSDALAVEHCMHDEVHVVKRVPRLRQLLLHESVDLEFPIAYTSRRTAKVDAPMLSELFDLTRKTVFFA